MAGGFRRATSGWSIRSTAPALISLDNRIGRSPQRSSTATGPSQPASTRRRSTSFSLRAPGPAARSTANRSRRRPARPWVEFALPVHRNFSTRLARGHSLALRLARVAQGACDAAFAGGNSHDWDLAAADLLVHEAGGALTPIAGGTLAYNRPVPRHGMLVAAGRARHAALIELL